MNVCCTLDCVYSINLPSESATVSETAVEAKYNDIEDFLLCG